MLESIALEGLETRFVGKSQQFQSNQQTEIP
jgi:hypothetical protein